MQKKGREESDSSSEEKKEVKRTHIETEEEKNERKLKELLEYGRDRDEKKFLQKWYEREYLPAVKEVKTVWMSLAPKWKASDIMAYKEHLEPRFYNLFVDATWPKYIRAAFHIMKEYNEPSKERPLLICKLPFPKECVRNFEHEHAFEKYVKSDMIIEVVRWLKERFLREVVDDLVFWKSYLEDWVREGPLKEDEQ